MEIIADLKNKTSDLVDPVSNHDFHREDAKTRTPLKSDFISSRLSDLAVKEKKPSIPEILHRKSIRQYGISPAETPLDDRKNFNLVVSSLTEEEAVNEASRCLLCDEICNVCVSVCPNLANFSYRMDPFTYALQKAVRQDDNTITFEYDQEFRIDQPYQILNIRDLCNECGNCKTFCPTSGSPYKDKPGLCLSVGSLNREGEGYYLSRLPKQNILIYKNKDQVKTLSLADNQYIYETDEVKAVFDASDFRIIDAKFTVPCIKECHFTFAAEMSVIMKGAEQLGFHS
jgi:putative selenate reductase